MSRPAFVTGSKALLLLKLVGEPSFGLEARMTVRANGRSAFVAHRVDHLSPADRAGIARGDGLYSIQVLGVDHDPYLWCADALQRVEQIHEVWVVKIWVIKRDGRRISELQEKRRGRIAHMLTRAKTIRIQGMGTRGDFIQSQLERVVVLIYDYEHAHFGGLWKALPEEERLAIAIPVARSFVSETRLPGLLGEIPNGTATPIPSVPSTPAQTPRSAPQPEVVDTAIDPDATESEVSTPLVLHTPQETDEEDEWRHERHVFIPLPNSYAPTRPSIDSPTERTASPPHKKARLVTIKAEMVDAP